MAILVTGGAGYIGSHTVLALLDAGENVVVVDDLSTGLDWAVPQAAQFARVDIGDETALDQILSGHSWEAIIHFAASVVVADSISDPLSYYLNNTVKTRGLIAAAVLAWVKRFIFSSTAAVTGCWTKIR